MWQERPNAHHLIAVMPSYISQLNKQMRSKAKSFYTDLLDVSANHRKALGSSDHFYVFTTSLCEVLTLMASCRPVPSRSLTHSLTHSLSLSLSDSQPQPHCHTHSHTCSHSSAIIPLRSAFASRLLETLSMWGFPVLSWFDASCISWVASLLKARESKV